MVLMKLKCPYFDQKTCQVCTKIHIGYPEQIETKKLIFQYKFPTQNLINFPSEPLAFRDKAKLQVSGTVDNPILGFLNPQSLMVEHEILACPLHNQSINDLIPKIKTLITKYRLTPYDIVKRSGELKGLILFHSPTSNEGYLRFILRSKESLDRLKKIVHDLPDVTSISANIQPTPHAILEGKEEIYFKNDSILHKFNNKELRLSPQGFVQTNTYVAEKLYLTAKEWLQDLSIKKACDVYCGHGPFSFHIEDVCEKVLGIEVNESAIVRANQSKNEFHYKSEFIADKAENLPKRILEFNPDLILVNPPRAGLRSFVEVIKEQAPQYILYSSCNVETLYFDIEQLKETYKICKTALFDMFPQSEHFEALVLCQRY
jgi:23S rRNA (uracil747-C5)-methyltransferase